MENQKLSAYQELKRYQKDYPELTFNNIGYEYLKPAVREVHEQQIKEISEILKKEIPSFVEFLNFKPRKKGGFAVRLNHYYDGLSGFIGVNYFDIEDFNNESIK